MKKGLRLYGWLWIILGNILNYFKIAHFRLLGIQIGKNCRIYSGVRISGNVAIGDNVRIGSYTYLNTYEDGRVTICNDVLIGSLTHIVSGHSSVEISDHCIFAPGVFISDGTHDIESPEVLIKHATVVSESVKIKKNVWLGAYVTVLKGVTIGEGAVVGAMSLVNKSVPPYSVAVGIPAAVLKSRQ